MGRKAVGTNCNINNAFGPGTANERTVQWCFNKLCEGDKSLEDEENSGWPLEVDNDNWESSSKLILLQLHEKLLKNSTSIVLQLFSIWSKLERWKSSLSGCLMSWPKIKKNRHFEVPSSLTVCNNKESFLDQIVMCNEKWTVYDNQRRPARWLDWDAPKHFPKPTLHQKKVKVTVWWSAACLIHYSFLNPDETITSEKYAQQINEMHWKTANACNQHWSTERAQFFSTTTPDHTLHNQHQKLNKLLPHLPYSPDLSPTNYQASQQFSARKKLPRPVGPRKCFPRVHRITKHGFFYATGINET